MKKVPVLVVLFFATIASFAQNDTTAVRKDTTAPKSTAPAKAATTTPSGRKDWSKVKITNRANDHFMLQFAYDNWAGRPDTITTGGFSRSFNFYFMYALPFKTDPRWSVAAGIGPSWSNVFFHQQTVAITALNPTLAFPSVSEGAKNFKKFKLVSAYLDIPIELRFAMDPENMNKSWKFAVGTKVGILLTTYTKAKDEQNSAGQTINSYIEKQVSKKYFNSTRLAPMIRVSKGVFGIYAQYQVTPFIKPLYGPNVYPFAIGIQLSGL